MSLVTEILTYDQLHDLWGAGFTIVRRNADPYEIDPKLIPRGMAYQWNPISGYDVASDSHPFGWKSVPYSRHEGVFAPWGTSGVIQRGGLELCERPKAEVDHQLERSRTKALQNVDDWVAKNGALGFTGSVKVGTQTKPGQLDTLEERNVGSDAPGDFVQIGSTKTIETIVAIPKDMTPHIAAIFKERDRLEEGIVRKDRTLAPGPIADKFYEAVAANERDGTPFQWWPTLRAILLPIAVDNVRLALRSLEITHPDGKEPTDE